MEKANAMDSLTAAVVGAECHAADKGWGRPPQLYALAREPEPVSSDQELAGELGDPPQDSLIPIPQDPLPQGEPAEVLATIHWADEVVGCVLVTELVVLPPETATDAPPEQAAAEQWAAGCPDRREARLAVGVLRDGRHTCCLQLRGDDEEVGSDDTEVFVGPDLADDLVAALLGTFL
jgi:hypothetical protein